MVSQMDSFDFCCHARLELEQSEDRRVKREAMVYQRSWLAFTWRSLWAGQASESDVPLQRRRHVSNSNFTALTSLCSAQMRNADKRALEWTARWHLPRLWRRKSTLGLIPAFASSPGSRRENIRHIKELVDVKHCRAVKAETLTATRRFLWS